MQLHVLGLQALATKIYVGLWQNIPILERKLTLQFQVHTCELKHHKPAPKILQFSTDAARLIPIQD